MNNIEILYELSKAQNQANSLLGPYAANMDDRVQDALIKIFEKPRDEITPELIQLILFGICRDWRQGQANRVRLEVENSNTINSIYGGNQDNDDPMESLMASQMIGAARTNMTPALQHIFNELYVEGKTVEQIAKGLGVKKNAVYRQVERIKEKFKEYING